MQRRLQEKIFESIQFRLVISFVISGTLIFALVLFSNQRIQQELSEKADQSLLLSAEAIATRLDEFHQRNLQSFQVFSKLPALTNFIEQTNTDTSNDVQADALETLQSFEIYPFNSFHVYVLSNGILDIDGINIMDTSATNIGNDESQRDYYQQALVAGVPFVSGLYYIPERSGIYFYYSVPIRRLEDPQPFIGVLRAQIALSTLQDIAFDAQPLGNQLHIMLFDENLVRIADNQSSESLFRSITTMPFNTIIDLQNNLRLPPLPIDRITVQLPDLAKNIGQYIHQQNNVFNAQTLSNDPTIERVAVVRTHVNIDPWYVAVAQPLSVHNLPVQQQAQSLALVAVAMTVGAMALVWYLSSRVTQPIRKLTKVAQQVAQGDLTIKAQVTSSDEIGVLANTFNQMTTELRQIKSTLEQRVEERTARLSAANIALQREMVERQRHEQNALKLALEQERIRILGEFIQDASHEFKTPLSIINVELHLLNRKFRLDEAVERHLIKIRQQSKSIEDLVNAMVMMMNLDSNHDGNSQNRIYINDLIRSLYGNEMESFSHAGVLLQTDIKTSDGDVIYGSAELLFIALQKLLDNSLRFTPAGGTVIIKAIPEETQAKIIISDSGSGIPNEILPRVFERFYRIDEAHSTRGFGLGLPIAKQIIEKYNGAIHIDSKVDAGTQVTIVLPLIHEPIET